MGRQASDRRGALVDVETGEMMDRREGNGQRRAFGNTGGLGDNWRCRWTLLWALEVRRVGNEEQLVHERARVRTRRMRESLSVQCVGRRKSKSPGRPDNDHCWMQRVEREGCR